jgi:hypothetical protein
MLILFQGYNPNRLLGEQVFNYVYIYNKIYYLAIYANAHAADYLTPGSNYYTHIVNDYRTPLFIIAFDKELECLANDLKTKHAAFL